MIDVARIRDELTPFADLGTEPPQHSTDGTRAMVRITRGGEPVEIRFQAGHDKVVEHSVDSHQDRTHQSYRALLASERFADLRQWANNQRQSLRHLQDAYDRRIPVTGVLSGADGSSELDVEKLDEFLASEELVHQSSVRVMVIDGPAGIGKTRFIEFLAWLRAERFNSKRRPLVLHVQSRGRVLTYLQDLIAFSLQRLRLNVTFDQVPVLVRHGLITLAVDGFDELADPNGYHLAWGQLSDLVHDVRGKGTLILAGRETFIDEYRIRSSIQSLRAADDVQTLTLQPPLPDTARNWLREQKLDDLKFADELFEPGSFALRPFFLVQLSQFLPESEFGSPQPGVLLASLIDSMIKREATKFGDPVNSVMTEGERQAYVRRFLQEAARFMADDQTETIDELSLTWITDVAAGPELPEDALGRLRHRASDIAFLEKDDTPGYRKFSHSKLFNHFLGDDVLDAIAREDVPKYVRRNTLGSDFLTTFSDLIVHLASVDPVRVNKSFGSALTTAQTYVWDDHGAQNLGALVIAMLPAIEDEASVVLQDIGAGEAVMRGTSPPAKMRRVAISQLDIQGANVESLEFYESQIGTITVDNTTLVSPSIPLPTRIQYNRSYAGRSKVISVYQEIESWLATHGRSSDSAEHDRGNGDLIPSELRSHPMVKLLGRACRSRSFWIPEGGTNYFEKFARDPSWPWMLQLLKEHGLVRVEELQAAGTGNRFYHIKQRVRILSEDADDEKVRNFYEALVRAMGESPRW